MKSDNKLSHFNVIHDFHGLNQAAYIRVSGYTGAKLVPPGCFQGTELNLNSLPGIPPAHSCSYV